MVPGGIHGLEAGDDRIVDDEEGADCQFGVDKAKGEEDDREAEDEGDAAVHQAFY